MNKKPVNIDEQRTEALAASLSCTGLDAFSISRFLKLLAGLFAQLGKVYIIGNGLQRHARAF